MKLSRSFNNIIFFLPLTILIVERTNNLLHLLLKGPIVPNKDFDSVSFNAPDHNYEKSAAQNHKEEHNNKNINENSGASDLSPLRSKNLQNNLQSTIVRPVDLDQVTKEEEEKQCPAEQSQIENKHLQDYGDNKIPRIVHQTSKSRCVTNNMFHVMQSWHLGDDWAYYFHSDEAMDRLFQMSWPEFPHLSTIIPCLNGKGTLKADLWRYLVLWEYGGIYADIDTKPNLLNATTITSKDDGFFVVEQYHMLSQYFMAVSPRHPIMFYTIHHVLSVLLDANDVGTLYAPQVTGPHALNKGFQYFMADKGIVVTDGGVGYKPAKAGLWVGTDDRSITVAGVGENENEYVHREYIKRRKKMQNYHALGMEHFTKEMSKSDKSCMRVLWETRFDSLKKMESKER